MSSVPKKADKLNLSLSKKVNEATIHIFAEADKNDLKG